MDQFSFESSSEGFLHLLQTQSSQTVDLAGGCSQVSEEQSSKSRRTWTPKEDLVLISAWLNTSKDPIVSNEQRGGTFWKRILEFVMASPLMVGKVPREAMHLKQRWARINDQVCKYVGCYEAALKQQSSGQNENDVMKAAHEIFYNDHRVKFTMEHAWRELRHDQKWNSSYLGKEGGKEKKKNVVEAEGSDSVNEVRPPGVRACKRKRTAKEEAREQVQMMMAQKEKLNNQKLLAQLLAKQGPLSEAEESFKNKLLTELL